MKLAGLDQSIGHCPHRSQGLPGAFLEDGLASCHVYKNEVCTSHLFHDLQGLQFQDAKADVILKYSADEARNLKSYGEFPESVKINETVEFGGEGDDDIEFDDVDSDGSGSDDGDDIDGI